MSETVTVALIAVLGTLLGTMLSPLLEYFREKRADRRSRAHEQLALLERTYEDVLASLSNWLIKTQQRKLTLSTPEDKGQFISESNRYSARLQLVSTLGIAKQYDETVVELINEEAYELLLSSAEEDTLSVLPDLFSNIMRPRTEAYDSLAQQMRQHLESVRKQTA
jgi:hypothetical protein